MAFVDPCPFCSPVSDLIGSTQHCFALLNYTPAVAGHFMVVPRRHITEFADLKAVEAADAFTLAETVYRRFADDFDTHRRQLDEFYRRQIDEPPWIDSDEMTTENIRHLNAARLSLAHLRGPVGYNIGLNKGEAAGQRVDHLHFHVFPRYTPGRGVVKAMRDLVVSPEPGKQP